VDFGALDFELMANCRATHKTMNPNSISHRLFIAALKPGEQLTGKRPSAARSLPEQSARNTNEVKSSPSISALASRQVADWSWSGWQHHTI